MLPNGELKVTQIPEKWLPILPSIGLSWDFLDEATYHRLCHDGPRFIDKVVAFILSIGFQLKHKCHCPGERLTRHSHYVRARINGITIWRVQCTACRAVFTVLPHFVLRYRKMKAEIAKKVL